jgi:transposase-like protein
MRKGAYEIKIVRNFSAEEKRKIIERVEKETDTISNQAKRLGIYPSTIWMWIQNYIDTLNMTSCTQRQNYSMTILPSTSKHAATMLSSTSNMPWCCSFNVKVCTI